MNDVTALEAVDLSAAPEEKAPAQRAPFVPSWHDPEDLAKALRRIGRSEAHRQRGNVASFMLPRLPRWTLVSDTLKTDRPSSVRRPMLQAWRAKWISLNTKTHVNARTVDMDHTNWREELAALYAQGVPEATWVVRNPETDHAQATWLLPIGVARANPAAMRILDGVARGLDATLDGDTQFKNWLIRNPLHPDHELVSFTGRTVELSDLLGPLIEWCDEGRHILAPRPRLDAQFEGHTPNIPAVPADLKAALAGKGARVWETGRHRVCRARTSDRAAIHRILSETAAELGSPIKPRALDGMVGRIAEWMAARSWANGAAARARRGSDGRPMTAEATARGMREAWIRTDRAVKLPLAAERTNAMRAGKTAAAIAAGMSALSRDGQEITQESLARASGLSVRTVARAWSKPVRANCQQYDTRSYPFSPPRSGGEQRPALLWEEVESLNRVVRESREAARREAEAVAGYDAQAARMTKRGGQAEDVVPPPADAAPAILSAWRGAVAARRDAVRREAQRRDAKAARIARAERWTLFLSLARADDEAGYRAWMRRETARWDDMAEAVARDDESRRSLRDRRGIHFARLASEWRQAKQAAATGHDHSLRSRKRTHTGRTDWHRSPDRHDRAARALTRADTEARRAERTRELQEAGWIPVYASGPLMLASREDAILPE